MCLQELMLDSAKTKNVIEATNKRHLFEKLEDLQKRLMMVNGRLMVYKLFLTALMSLFLLLHHLLCFYRLVLCEKALAEYLETKRLAFPRFYFVSSADLLDILSKGSRPRAVCHLLLLCGFSRH